MKICPLEHRLVYAKFGKKLKAERVAIKKDDKKTKYFAMTYLDNPIGVVGYQWLSETHVRLKTDFIEKQFRGEGHYSKLWDAREEEIKGAKVFSAYCTQYSLPKYLKEGFVIQSGGRNGIVYVKK